MTRETILERDWRISKELGSFGVTRHKTYHPTYGCSFRIPVLRSVAKDDQGGPFVKLTPEWVGAALETLIRDEGSGRHGGAWPTAKHEMVTISDEIVYDLLTHYEEQIAFGEKTEVILEDGRLPKPEDKIAAILSEPTFGNKKNAHVLTKAEIERGLNAARSSDGPLVFLLPAFPFKDQNPFRSDLPSSVPDFGEIAMLIHLHCLAMAMNQVFRHDVMWLIVSDGTVYEEMFGAESGSGHRYLSALHDWRSRLNIGGSIHLIDLQDIVSKYNEEFRAKPECAFSTIYRQIAEILQSTSNADPTCPNATRNILSKLARGMLWNKGWNKEVCQYGYDALWKIHQALCEKSKLAPNLHTLADELWIKTIDTAIKYAAFNLTARYTQLYSRFMPSAIRATSHVKPGQVGIPRETGVAPWNGLAVYERRSNTSIRVRSTPMCQIPQQTDVRFRLNSGMFGFGFAVREAINDYL